MSEGNVRGRIKSERTWLVHDDQTDTASRWRKGIVQQFASQVAVYISARRGRG